MVAAPPTATEFAGNARFQIVERLGAGGMGVVYRAFDRETDQHVALKTLAKVSAAAIYRFKQEFRALANVTHPNLVQLHELISVSNQWFFTMELVQGVTFLEWVRSDDVEPEDDVITALCTVPVGSDVGDAAGNDTIAEPMSFPSVPRPGAQRPPELALRPHGDARPRGISSPLNVTRLREALRQLAHGVSALHQAGKLHRDIKPSNVMVTREGRVVLLDFGLVLDLSQAEGDALDAPLLGTAAYMSPEQGGRVPLTPASDWYGVGVVLYQALTGRLPFYGDNAEILEKKVRSEPTPPRVLVPQLPRDLNELCVALLRMEPERRPSGPELLRRLDGVDTDTDESGASVGAVPLRYASVAPTADATTFLGREQLFAKLTNAFTDMGPGHPVTVFVSGRSGFGKSALVARFLDALTSGNRAFVLQGRCYEHESVPYKALDSAVDDLSQHLRRMPSADVERLLPPGIGALARVFPVLRGIDAVARSIRQAPEVRDKQQLRVRAFAAFRELLTSLARRRPLVVHIDDLQWGDIDSAQVLRDLLRPPNPPAVLLVGVYQSEYADKSPVLEALLDEATMTGVYAPDVRRITVGPLTPYESRDLALALLGRSDAAAKRHAEAIALESGGSPLFVQELVRYALAVSGGHLETTTPSSVGMTLEQALTMRLVQLTPEALALLEVVAVAGRPLKLDVALTATGLGPEGRSALAQLRSGHLVRTATLGEEEIVETTHERVTGTVLDGLDRDTLSFRHGALARALEQSGADAELLAVHFAGAGDAEKTGLHAEAAAKKAAEALAFDRAVHLFHLAIDSCEEGQPRRRTLSIDLGDALAAAGRGAEAARVYIGAAAGADPMDSLRLRRQAAEQLLRAGHRDEGLEVLAEVLGEVDMGLPKSTRQVVLSLLTKRLHIRLRGYGFKEREESEVSREDLMRIDVAWTAVIGLGLLDALRAAEFQSRHLLLALAAGEPVRVTRALAAEATYAAAGGTRNVARTRRLLDEMDRLSKRSGQPYPLAMAAIISGVASYLQGAFGEAAGQIERGELILKEQCTGVAWDLASAQMFSLAILGYTGDLKSLAQRVPALVIEAEERGDRYAATVLRTGMRNMAWLVVGDAEEARRQLGEARLSWTKQGFLLPHYFMLLAEAHIDLYLGDGAAAADRLLAEWESFRRSMLLRVQFLRIEAYHLKAKALIAKAIVSADRDRVLAQAEVAIRLVEKEGVAWADSIAALLRGCAATVRHDADAAVDLFTSAAVGLDAAGMKFFATVARRRLGELVGGDGGRLRIEAADAWMRGEGVREPGRLAAMVAPVE